MKHLLECNFLTGEAVMDFYINPGRYSESSMTGPERGRYTKFYADNPDKVGLIVSEDRNARALVWTCDNGERVLDVIYGTKMGSISILSWAHKNNVKYVFTINRNYNKYRVSCKIKDEYMPYIDCFKFAELDFDKYEITLTLVPNKNTNVECSSHDGFIYRYHHRNYFPDTLDTSDKIEQHPSV